MEKRPESLLPQLEEYLKFFAELGAEFILRPAGPSRPGASLLASPELSYDKVRDKITRCTLCPLSRLRTHAVPGEGNLKAALMFVGEAPGHDEDVQGRPFVGRAGQLLTKIILAMKFQREDVYITNIVKCRPPENRTPHRDEIEKCTPYLLHQLSLIRPKVIVTLGKIAADFFIQSPLAMTALRGNFFEYQDIRVMPTFHPSYLIRNEGNRELKKMVWEDMQKVMALLDKK